MNLREKPSFPKFEQDSDYTKLSFHPSTHDYNYLPGTWDFVQCFDYYLMQNAKWSTKSSEDEWKSSTSNEKIAHIRDALFPSSSNEDQEEDEEGETKMDDKDKHEAQLVVNNNAKSPMKQQSKENTT